MIQETSQGQALLKKYAINYNSVDPHTAYNDYIARSVQLAHAMQIDNHFIQPIPNDLKQQAQAAFIQGADPDSLLQILDKHDPANKVYLAASLKKPLEQEVAYTVGMLQDHTDVSFLRQLISANQTGHDFSKISIANRSDSEVSDKSLKHFVVAQLQSHSGLLGHLYNVVSDDPATDNSDIFNYLSLSGDPSRTLSVVNMAMNYVKYQGLIHNDLALQNVNDYMQTFNQHFANAYRISKGSNYIFNTKDFGITESETANLAKHVSDQAYQALGIKDKKETWRDTLKTYFESDRDPLTITNTPDGLIIAVDQAGTVVYSQPFTDSLVTYAHRKH